jgi:hypothetical protein
MERLNLAGREGEAQITGGTGLCHLQRNPITRNRVEAAGVVLGGPHWDRATGGGHEFPAAVGETPILIVPIAEHQGSGVVQLLIGSLRIQPELQTRG